MVRHESLSMSSVAGRSLWKFGGMWGKTAFIMTKVFHGIAKGINFLKNVFSKALDFMSKRLKQFWFSLKILIPVFGSIFLHSAQKMERALRNVTSLMAGSGAGEGEIEKTIKKWSMQMQRMSVQYGISGDHLASGMYNVVSATFEGADAMKILDTSAKAATASLMEVEDMTKILTVTLQAYRKEGETNAQLAERSTKIADLMFMAVNRGMFTMGELSSFLGAIPAMASAFNIPLEQILAAFSTLTRRGITLEETATGIRQILVSLADLQPQQKDAAEALWGKNWKSMWGAEALAKKGIPGMLQSLTDIMPQVTDEMMTMASAIEDEGGSGMDFLAKSIGGTMELLSQLFPNIRAFKAVLGLLGPGMEMFMQDYGYMMNESAGATERAMGEMSKSAEYQVDRTKKLFMELGKEFGKVILPFLSGGAEAVANWFGEVPMAWGISTGLVDQLNKEGLSRMEIIEEVTKGWDDLTPWDRLYFTFTTGFNDLADRLQTWLNAEGGREKIRGISRTLGELFQSIFTFDFTGSEGGMTGSFAGALVDAFSIASGSMVEIMAGAIRDYDWTTLLDTTIGAALAWVGAFRVGRWVVKVFAIALLISALKANTAAVTANTAAALGESITKGGSSFLGKIANYVLGVGTGVGGAAASKIGTSAASFGTVGGVGAALSGMLALYGVAKEGDVNLRPLRPLQETPFGMLGTEASERSVLGYTWDQIKRIAPWGMDREDKARDFIGEAARRAVDINADPDRLATTVPHLERGITNALDVINEFRKAEGLKAITMDMAGMTVAQVGSAITEAFESTFNAPLFTGKIDVSNVKPEGMVDLTGSMDVTNVNTTGKVNLTGDLDVGGGTGGAGWYGTPVEIPKFARGGIIRKPTIGMVGEAGPEAIIPLGGGPVDPSLRSILGPRYGGGYGSFGGLNSQRASDLVKNYIVSSAVGGGIGTYLGRLLMGTAGVPKPGGLGLAMAYPAMRSVFGHWWDQKYDASGNLPPSKNSPAWKFWDWDIWQSHPKGSGQDPMKIWLGGVPGGVANLLHGVNMRIPFPFARGGIVRKPTLGLVGEAGPEAILPLAALLGTRYGGTTSSTADFFSALLDKAGMSSGKKGTTKAMGKASARFGGGGLGGRWLGAGRMANLGRFLLPTSIASLAIEAALSDFNRMQRDYSGGQLTPEAAARLRGGGLGSVLGSRYGIPSFATGGIVTKPTLSLYGEAGPEAVVPLTNILGSRYGGTGSGGLLNTMGGWISNMFSPANVGPVVSAARALAGSGLLGLPGVAMATGAALFGSERGAISNIFKGRQKATKFRDTSGVLRNIPKIFVDKLSEKVKPPGGGRPGQAVRVTGVEDMRFRTWQEVRNKLYNIDPADLRWVEAGKEVLENSKGGRPGTLYRSREHLPEILDLLSSKTKTLLFGRREYGRLWNIQSTVDMMQRGVLGIGDLTEQHRREVARYLSTDLIQGPGRLTSALQHGPKFRGQILTSLFRGAKGAISLKSLFALTPATLAIDFLVEELIRSATGGLMNTRAASFAEGGVNAYRQLARFLGIPHFARGGIIRKPTLGLMGEAGPEAVVPMSGIPPRPRRPGTEAHDYWAKIAPYAIAIASSYFGAGSSAIPGTLGTVAMPSLGGAFTAAAFADYRRMNRDYVGGQLKAGRQIELSALGLWESLGPRYGGPVTKSPMKKGLEQLAEAFGIPGFARGGIVRKPTLGLVGEAGPEAVVPMSIGIWDTILDRAGSVTDAISRFMGAGDAAAVAGGPRQVFDFWGNWVRDMGDPDVHWKDHPFQRYAEYTHGVNYRQLFRELMTPDNPSLRKIFWVDEDGNPYAVHYKEIHWDHTRYPRKPPSPLFGDFNQRRYDALAELPPEVLKKLKEQYPDSFAGVDPIEPYLPIPFKEQPPWWAPDLETLRILEEMRARDELAELARLSTPTMRSAPGWNVIKNTGPHSYIDWTPKPKANFGLRQKNVDKWYRLNSPHPLVGARRSGTPRPGVWDFLVNASPYALAAAASRNVRSFPGTWGQHFIQPTWGPIFTAAAFADKKRAQRIYRKGQLRPGVALELGATGLWEALGPRYGSPLPKPELEIPYMARGGIVTKPTLAMIGEAGPEAVVPLSKGTGSYNIHGDVNIQVDASSMTDPDEVAAAVHSALLSTFRNG